MNKKLIMDYRNKVAKATEELLKEADETVDIIESIVPVAISNFSLMSQFIQDDRFIELVNQLPQDILDHVEDVNKALNNLDSKKVN